MALVLSLCALAPACVCAGPRPRAESTSARPCSDDLKRLQRDEPAPATLFDAQRQADRAEDVVRQFLESEGYYQAEVEGWAEAGNDNAITRGVHVTLGPLFTFASRQIDYLDAPPDEETQAALEKLLEPVAVGAPARAAGRDRDRRRARRRPQATPAIPMPAPIPPMRWPTPRRRPSTLTYKLQPGQRASFGALTVSGLVRTKQDYIADLRPWKPGERYTPEKMDEFRARLAETGLFDTASARLAATGEPQSQTAAAPARRRGRG